MISLPDINVLLDAVNPGALRHGVCRTWLDEQISNGAALGWAWNALVGFVRLTTTKPVFANPLSVAESMNYVDAWLALPNSRVLAPGTGHSSLVRNLLTAAGVAGNLVPDAHLAALAIEHGAELCSCDTDFGRFRGLRWFNPATGSRSRP